MHPYLRAYMAGIALPTLIAPFVAGVIVLHHPSVDRGDLDLVAVFPIGLVPNAWGLWNMLYLRLSHRREIPIGIHGAALVAVVVPAAYGVQVMLGTVLWSSHIVWVGLPAILVLYYLAWKYIVARLNIALGIG
jgi:hypothetical protein